ncbi:carboxypeptidase regulatory-like domain-containing protein [Microbacterium sp. NPDC019599]|uniref:carboxypeptidase regulatory-like domain-containing protein n=1 Tax=Microbacterium sp. NPDC019599 TaxID=3154690 RepID=UPI00340BC162
MPGTGAPGIPVRSLLRTTLAVVLAALLALAVAHPAAADDPSPAASVSGVVTGSAGQPLAGAGVYLMEDFGNGHAYTAYATTDASGSYRFENVEPAAYTLRFYPVAGHVGEWWNDQIGAAVADTFDVQAGAALTGMDAQLSAGASVSGVVSDPSGVPVPGSAVKLYDVSGISSWRLVGAVPTDESGRYRFATLDPGSYVVLAAPPTGSDLVSQWWPDAPYRDGATRFPVARDQTMTGIDVRLPRGAAIEGVVTDEAGAPLIGAFVRAIGDGDPAYPYDEFTLYAQTDAQGHYVFDHLAAGEYHLGFRPPEGANYLERRSDSFTLGAGATVREDVALEAGGSLSGIVTGRDDLPLAGATVSLSRDGEGWIADAHTDETGAYRFTRLAGGSYTLQFAPRPKLHFNSPPGHFSEWWPDSPEKSGREWFSIQAGRHLDGMDAALTPEAMIQGTVAGSDGDGVQAGVRLYSVEDGRHTFIESAYVLDDGRYWLDELRSGTYTLKFTESNHLDQWWGGAAEEGLAETFEVATGESLTGMDAALAAGASIGGTVTGPDGAPVRSAVAFFYKVTPTGPVYFTNRGIDDSGRYYLGGLTAGVYTVRFSASATALAEEWWNDSPSAEGAQAITIADGEPATGIDAELQPKPVSVGVPRLSGTAAFGSTLSTSVSTSPTNATLGFEWRADGSIIEGATSSSLVLGPAEVGKTISVRVTATAPGYAPGSRESAASAPVAAAVLASATPQISGSAATGSSLSVDPGAWTADTVFEYQWHANGVPIDGATDAALVLGAEQAGKRISVSVTGSKPGHLTTSRSSAQTSKVYLTGTPTVSGTRAVGSTLTAKPGAWATGSALKYQWFASGTAIRGATATTLKLSSAHAGRQISVRVTGTAPDYPTATRDSARTLKIATVGSPRITGAAATGATLRADPGIWTPGTSFAYQWYANGTAVAGATRSTFLLTSVQAGSSMTVRVTGSLEGYSTLTKMSSGTARVYRSPSPSISGVAAVGSTMTVVRGTWTTGSTYAYQWYANGVAISGATSTSLTLTGSHADKQITVRVTGRLSGYPTTQRTSAPTLRVTRWALPTISGTPAVGSTLTASPNTWSKGTTFTYQWYANGAAVPGATSPTLRVAPDHVGRSLTVKVTGTQSGYGKVSKVSAATAKSALVGSPTVSGTPAVGSTMTASPGVWTTGTALTYQWYADGVAITGATARSLTVTTAHVNKELTVRVTGRLSGYPTVSRLSTSTPKVTLAVEAVP